MMMMMIMHLITGCKIIIVMMRVIELTLTNNGRTMTDDATLCVTRARVTIAYVYVIAAQETVSAVRVLAAALVLSHAARWHYRRPTVCISLMMMRRHGNQDGDDSQPQMTLYRRAGHFLHECPSHT